MTRLSPLLLFAIAFALFLTVVYFTFRQADLPAILAPVTLGAFIGNLVLGLAWFLAFGLVLKFGFKTHYSVTLEPAEVLTLPLMMYLFAFILPLNGGLLFQVFYMKHRHQLDLSKGVSLGFQIVLVSLLLTVVLGLGLHLILGLPTGPLLFLLLALGLGLLILPLIAYLLPIQNRRPPSLMAKLWGFLDAVRLQLTGQFTHPRLMLQLALTTTLLVIIQALWYQQSATMLGIESEFLPMLLVALILRIVLLLRLLPGNLGFQELMIGVVFAAAGWSIEEGLLVALVIRLVSVLLAATIGMAGLYANLKSMNSLSVRSLIKTVSDTEWH